MAFERGATSHDGADGDYPMPMSADVLGPAMKSAIDALTLTTDSNKNRDAVFRAMAGAIVEHIQQAATVTALVVGSSVTGGPVTGTATGGPGSVS
jgi:hypothetical protein